MLLVGQQEGHQACKKNGGWWRQALVSPDGLVPSWMVSISASVNLPLHHKVQKFSSGIGSPGGPVKRAVKQLWCGYCSAEGMDSSFTGKKVKSTGAYYACKLQFPLQIRA